MFNSSGSALILNPLTLSAFLHTLLILLHASQHSPAFLALLAPKSLELALTLGSLPLSTSTDNETEKEKEQEAAPTTAALSLSLLVLDGCINLDGGRTLCLDPSQRAILAGVREWAGRVMGALERGERMPGEGGVLEARLRRSAAGVVLKAEQVMARWRASMVDAI